MDDAGPLNVLVIEDDADTRSNLRDILELDDHHVEEAGTAAEALARRDWAPIAAILLDRKLPDALADDLLPKLKALAPQAAVMIVTGYADLQGAVSALRLGATDYILKPIDPDELRNRLRRVASHRATKEALHLAEHRYRMLVQNSSDIITMLSADGTVLYTSPTVERMLGYRPEQRVGKNIFGDPIIHPDDMATKRAFLDAARRRPGSPARAEFRLRHADGSWRYIEAVGQDLLDEPGVNAIVASYRDITDRRQAEEALRASEERYRRLNEAGIIGVGVSDDSGAWLEANDELLRILGSTRQDLGAGRVRWDVATPARYAALDRRGVAEARRRGACTPYEKQYLRPDGSLVPVLIGYAALGASDDQFLCVVLDMTATKRAENLLRRERDFARGLIEGAPAVILVLDAEGRIIRFNRFAEALSGYRAEEVLGRPAFETLLPPRDHERVRGVFDNTLREGNTSGTINPIRTRDGREREIQWSYRLLRDERDGLLGVLAIGQDITELKEAQDRALRSERLAAIGQMVAGLAHESRNALQRSQACLEMLALKVEDRPEALGLIARIQTAQDHLHCLYEDVRDYAAPIRLDRVPSDLASVWREAWAHLEPQRKGHAAGLRETTAGVDLSCAADPFRLGRVFGNIFENALAACADPVEITIACAPATLLGRPALRVSVRDNGPGLDPDARQRIFEPFFTTKTKGTGLGMAISRRIVEAHGGRIVIGEGAGPGAEVIITLPRGEVSP